MPVCVCVRVDLTIIILNSHCCCIYAVQVSLTIVHTHPPTVDRDVQMAAAAGSGVNSKSRVAYTACCYDARLAAAENFWAETASDGSLATLKPGNGHTRMSWSGAVERSDGDRKVLDFPAPHAEFVCPTDERLVKQVCLVAKSTPVVMAVYTSGSKTPELIRVACHGTGHAWHCVRVVDPIDFITKIAVHEGKLSGVIGIRTWVVEAAMQSAVKISLNTPQQVRGFVADGEVKCDGAGGFTPLDLSSGADGKVRPNWKTDRTKTFVTPAFQIEGGTLGAPVCSASAMLFCGDYKLSMIATLPNIRDIVFDISDCIGDEVRGFVLAMTTNKGQKKMLCFAPGKYKQVMCNADLLPKEQGQYISRVDLMSSGLSMLVSNVLYSVKK